MIIFGYIISIILFLLVLAPIGGLAFFILYAVRLEWKNKHRHGLIPKVILIIFLLAIIGGIFRTIQVGYNCYRLTGKLICGGNAPDDEKDFVFPAPR